MKKLLVSMLAIVALFATNTLVSAEPVSEEAVQVVPFSRNDWRVTPGNALHLFSSSTIGSSFGLLHAGGIVETFATSGNRTLVWVVHCPQGIHSGRTAYVANITFSNGVLVRIPHS